VLSPYDELPVHQTPHPVLDLQNSDPGFDDGYYFGVYSAAARVFCFMGLRVSPNTDLVGGYAAVNVAGRQRTVRFSRRWRELCDTVVGPFSFRIVEPYRDVHLVLADNEAGLAFDLHWLGRAPAYLEAHHLARGAARRTTDQSRYVQAGTAAGVITLDGHRWDVVADEWAADRDHAWGLYFDRPPLAPDPRWLPPASVAGPRRALRFWSLFSGGGLDGFAAIHETPAGERVPMNDTFGTPFEGRVHTGWDTGIEFRDAQQTLELVPGTRLLQRAELRLVDVEGGVWRQEYTPAAPPWVTSTIGYQAGSWRDGGSMRTWHGPGTTVEWDEFYVADQPLNHVLYDGTQQPELIGKEYVCRVRTVTPDGRSVDGQAHVELFLDGPYAPLGLT
jgi:hypothetical protein